MMLLGSGREILHHRVILHHHISITICVGASKAQAALPETTRKRGKRKAQPEEAAFLQKKACTIANGPKVGLS